MLEQIDEEPLDGSQFGEGVKSRKAKWKQVKNRYDKIKLKDKEGGVGWGVGKKVERSRDPEPPPAQ
jgi:hypothetical protein